ncbi:MAG TPA: hypothetical protein DEQ09_11890 [Bacteroidales bacterium]|nr:hypothetical protein [Bacteroidales bacterium]
MFGSFSNRSESKSEVKSTIKENLAAITSVPIDEWGARCTNGCMTKGADPWELCVMCNFPSQCLLLFSNVGIGTTGQCLNNPD